MDKDVRDKIWDILSKEYPSAHCELGFGNAFELLVAVILSAQCTDKRVNEVTKTLFARANTPLAFASMPLDELERLVRPCGFYRNKARNIRRMSEDVVRRFDGNVPKNFDDLLTLAGVGRKTAGVVCDVAFGGDAIPVDTHVFRLSRRLGLSAGKTPYDVEKDLLATIEVGSRSKVHHLLIFHGRYCCKARKPECKRCPIAEFCPSCEKSDNP